MYSSSEGAADATITAAVRNDVIQASQRRDHRRLCAIAEDLVSKQKWSGPQLDAVLLAHNMAGFAALNGSCLQLISAAGCNPLFADGCGDTVAHYAVRANNLSLLRALTELLGRELLDVKNNHLGSSLIVTAAAEANDVRAYEVLSTLEWLYLQGGSIEAFDNRGKTGLLWAAQRGSVVLVQWFLARGANLAHRDFNHRTALMLACVSGNRECLLYLCHAGAINMLEAQSTDAANGGGASTALGVCAAQSHFFLGLTLRLWARTHSLTRRLSLFNSQYGWYYLEISLLNLAVFLGMSPALFGSHRSSWLAFALLFCTAQLAWLFTYNADPGYVKRNVLPSQSYRCSANGREDLRKSGVFPCKPNSSRHQLQQLERENALLAFDIGLVFRQCRVRPSGGLPTSGAAGEALRPLLRRLGENARSAARLRAGVASERRAACPNGYAAAVLSGSPKKVCLTCGIVKPFRAHHCSDCGHCVHRFDHHCVWVDNCVGEGNQRAFLAFLAALCGSLLSMAQLSALYLAGAVGHSLEKEGQAGQEHSSSLLTSPLAYVVLLNLLSNAVWGVFVGYLLVRTAKSMITNVTFYEYLKLPTHIVRRFRGNVSGICWDLRDCTLARALRNSFAFCTRSKGYDALDYPENNNSRGAENKRRKSRSDANHNNSAAAAAATPALYIGPAQPLLMYDDEEA